MTKRSPTYHDYLQLDRILDAQLPPTFETDSNRDTFASLLHHEELLFIVMHQTIELWFKLDARGSLGRPRPDRASGPQTDSCRSRRKTSRAPAISCGAAPSSSST